MGGTSRLSVGYGKADGAAETTSGIGRDGGGAWLVRRLPPRPPSIQGHLRWMPDKLSPPTLPPSEGCQYFTDEAHAAEDSVQKVLQIG